MGTFLGICGALLVGVNLVGLGLFLRYDRRVVQRWTSPWIAANLLLLGVGAGVPMVAGIVRAAVAVFSATTPPVRSAK